MIALAGLRFAWRLLGMILTFLLLVPLHVALSALGFRQAIPQIFLRWIGYSAGLRISVEGAALPGALLLANHVSWLDIMALAGTARARFVAHSGLAGHKALKWLCDQNDTVFITRDQRRTVDTQIAQVRAELSQRPLTIFPEATTNDGRALLPFRSSLLAAVEPMAGTVPVQPVALDYTDARGIAWFGEEAGAANVRRILTRPGPIRLTIRFLAPLGGEELRDRKAMAHAAQMAIGRALRL